MTFQELQTEAKQLRALRAQEDVAQLKLRINLGEYLKGLVAKTTAETLGVSEQYLCDIRNGRRKISDEFLERLCGKKGR